MNERSIHVIGPMKNRKQNILILSLFGLVFLATVTSQAQEQAWDKKPEAGAQYRTITDMAGRKIRIPVNIKRVMPSTLVYMLAPEKMCELLSTSSRENKKYIPKKYRKKTIFRGDRGRANIEATIAANPDLVFVGVGQNIELLQEKYGNIPLVCVENTRDALGYSPGLLFTGYVLGVPDRAAKLNAYYQGVLKEVQTTVAKIPPEKRTRVYYAEGNNGLSTDPSGSCHS
ncbi:MAG: ABC transporter substrate-binding protein [Desulfobacteraceae bacterium]|jgi:iron complex transport system substrate-binding protein